MSSITKLVNFESEELNAIALDILTKLERKYGRPSCGNSRATFISKHCVFKFPLNFKGLRDNTVEGKKPDDDYAQYAKSRLMMLGDFNCIVQEKLIMPKSLAGLPVWIMSIDCCQVGYDLKGRLKAYDFAG